MTQQTKDNKYLGSLNSTEQGNCPSSREEGQSKQNQRPDPEVSPKKTKRKFSVQYKLRILEEADACTDKGQIGALLRREGLYSARLTEWRKQREQGMLQGLSPKKGRKPNNNKAEQERIQQLERENARLQVELKKAQAVIEVQKKISEILGDSGNFLQNSSKS